MIRCDGIKGKKTAIYGSIGLVQEIKTWKVTPGGIVSNINQNLRLEESN